MKHVFRRPARWLFGTLCCVLGAATAGWARPILSTLAPASGPVGTAVTITGTGFGATAAQNAVYFDAVRATVTSASATQLRVTVPAGAAAAAAVTVINTADGQQGSSVQDGAGAFRVTFAGGSLTSGSFARTDVTLGINYSTSSPYVLSSPLVPADFNQDGHLDVLGLTNGVVVTYGNGNGTFQAPALLAAGFQPINVAVADFTGDGLLDIVTLNNGSQDLSLLAGRGSSGFAAAQTFYSNTSTSEFLSQALLAKDLDGNGRVDLLLTILDVTGPSVRYEVLYNQATGFVPAALTLPGGTNAYPSNADNFSADSRPDLLGTAFVSGGGGGNADSLAVRVWRRNAANTGYEAPEVLPAVTLNNWYKLVVADVDLDGLRDVVLATMNSAQPTAPIRVHVWRRNATNTGFRPADIYYTPGLPSGVISGGNSALTDLQVADADGDGAPDLVLGVYARLSVLRNNGSGTGFAAAVNYTSSNGVKTVGTGDFNGDGRTDFITHNLSVFGSFDSSLFLNAAGSTAANNPPTLNALSNLTIDEDSGLYTVALSGIGTGGEAGQTVTLTAVSSDVSVLPNPTISYISPASTGTLRLRPATNAFGTVTVTVTASDGQTQNGSLTRSFQVTINPVNDAPTLDSIADIAVMSNGLQPVPLWGITSGAPNENETLTVTGMVTFAGNGSAAPTHTVYYNSPDYFGEVRVNVNALTPGLYSTNTVTVTDAAGAAVTRTYRVYYRGNTLPGNPTLDPIANRTADRSLTAQPPVALTGISDGDPLLTLPLTITATSSDPDLISITSLSYTNPSTTGTLRYALADPTRSGTVTITVVAGLGQTGPSTYRSFTVTVPTVTAAKSATALAALQLFPNPSADGRFTLQTEPVAGPATLSVLDALGREVWQQRLAAVPARLAVQPVGLQPRSVYVVRLTTERGTASRRLLLQ
ncbi:FG-GAP-like repeat-containing protein [Hymenobacter sp. 15J16-1T3B]|uniref:FG-GAP-like repeat-containing protein n=1 Tax=Hymenobacter sp. 15J16-1T3B TaxID=2886941 RepID=UPI001D125EC0|nr:FG-GAP-like repeat-containing protein [Hymenobacter sp. 15J16-1T3B]MCC3158839.1 FG-GAP-like repeat-containing protein [Hymenobacter sp. 15J16-1T3B]